MEKFSVKKPFTVLVAVIMVIMLGLVSVQNMQTNLLPNVNTPYLWWSRSIPVPARSVWRTRSPT